ncbi:MAG: hypothetical protein SPL89_05040 [Clostridia bacterium]|nr:hypothetical protein [Clostridia bacterium]
MHSRQRNIVEVILGNGWYNQYEKIAEGDLWYGSPKLWYEIVSDGKTIPVSNEKAECGFESDN